MHPFIAHARQGRLAIATSAVLVLIVIHGATSAVLVLMMIHGAAPAIAGGGIGGSANRQATAHLFGGNASGGGIENRGTSPVYASQMEKISGMAQATPPTLGFETVKGMLGDGDEVYLDTGQLADFYRFSTKAPKMTYTITAASTDFPVALTLYGLDPKQQGYVALQAAKVFTPDAPVAQYGGTLPKVGEYAIQISSASVDDQNGRYGLALSGAPGEVSDLSSGGGAKNAGETGEVTVNGSFPGVKAASVHSTESEKINGANQADVINARGGNDIVQSNNGGDAMRLYGAKLGTTVDVDW